MISCVKLTGILVIRETTAELPNNSNTKVQGGTSAPHVLHLIKVATFMRDRNLRTISTSIILAMIRAKSVLKTFSKIIGKTFGMAQA